MSAVSWVYPQRRRALNSFETDSTGYVTILKLRGALMEVCMSREHKGTVLVRDDEETLREAFRAFDRDGKGYIEAAYLKQVMSEMGEAFTEDEISEMVEAAQDEDTGLVFYQDFAALLAMPAV